MSRPRARRLATVSTAGSYLSSSDKRVHFGLGAEKSRNVEIRWPSGIRQTLKNVAGRIRILREWMKPSRPNAARTQRNVRCCSDRRRFEPNRLL